MAEKSNKPKIRLTIMMILMAIFNDNDDINGNIWKAAEENSKY